MNSLENSVLRRLRRKFWRLLSAERSLRSLEKWLRSDGRSLHSLEEWLLSLEKWLPMYKKIRCRECRKCSSF